MLKNISEFLQQVAEVIAIVLSVEVVIIDSELVVVAGTGKAACYVGTVMEGSITEEVLVSGEFHLVDDTHAYERCQSCDKRNICRMAIIYPINVNGQILGTIGLAAMDEFQQKQLFINRNTLSNFIEKISLLVTSKILEKEMNDKQALMAKQFETVINFVHEGVLAVNHLGVITHCNTSASKLINLNTEDVVGTQIGSLFSELKIKELLCPRTVQREIMFTSSDNKRKHLMAMINPILQEGMAVGAVISFRNIKEITNYLSLILGDSGGWNINNIIGQSSSIRQLKERVIKIADTNSTVLIRGESGTGKELFARALHTHHKIRHNGPFISINCGAIPESLLESELFGYEEGAFTGARKGGKLGKFEMADGGTIFLDEVGDMPLHLQVKILRVLEEKRIERVGGTTQKSVDVRIIAATNRDLEKMIAQREFREDLYYRLNVIPINIPPLRERGEDLQLFLDYFLQKYTRIAKKNILEFSPEVEEILLNHNWPGNVRELENAIEYAVNMESGPTISLENLPSRLLDTHTNSNNFRVKQNLLKIMETDAIKEALDRFGNDVNGKIKAAKFLGISRATLYRRLKELNVTNTGI